MDKTIMQQLESKYSSSLFTYWQLSKNGIVPNWYIAKIKPIKSDSLDYTRWRLLTSQHEFRLFPKSAGFVVMWVLVCMCAYHSDIKDKLRRSLKQEKKYRRVLRKIDKDLSQNPPNIVQTKKRIPA